MSEIDPTIIEDAKAAGFYIDADLSIYDDEGVVGDGIHEKLIKFAQLREARAKVHLSDCAVHNMPAYPNGPCDCGVADKALAVAYAQDNLIDIFESGSKVSVISREKSTYDGHYTLALYTIPPTAVREALAEFIALANKHTAHSSQDRNGEERFQNVFKVASDLIDLADKHRALIEQYA